MVGDSEPVCLVSHSLQQIESLTVARHDNRVRLRRHPYLFQPLGQADHRDVGNTEFVDYRTGRVDLRRAAVDDVQIGRIGESTRLPFRRKKIRIALIAQVPQEAAPGHLGNTGHVVGAPLACGFPDPEVAVVRLARQAVFERHQ